MKIKPIIGAAILTLAAFATPARGQGRNCWVDDRSGQVICSERRDRYNDRFEERNRRYDRDRNYRYTEIENRITQLYREVLSRNPDRGGLRTYTQRVLDGWDYRRVRRDLARSPEARDRINQLYREILGRNADRGGLRNYQRHLENGWSLRQVREELIRSPEARSRNRNRRYYR